MVSSWWIIWVLFMLLFLVPTGYGWGYRGWGPPYPRYLQRRRGQAAVAAGGSSTFNHQSWGFAGDFVWLVFAVGLFWLVFGFLRR